MIIKVRFIAIANILADKEIMPEFIQFNANPQKIANSIIQQLALENYSQKVQELLSLRKLFGSFHASEKAASIIINDKIL
jgi:lipid-A-disaccharide synthase